MSIDWWHGPRDQLRPLFELAEDSEVQLASYLNEGRVLVAMSGDDILGHLQLIASGNEMEIKSMAVRPDSQGQGIGRELVEAARTIAGAESFTRMTVSTAAAAAQTLRFYQRVGFRMASIERDAFTPETGYPDPIFIEGVLLRDRVWLDCDLRPAAS